MIPQSETKFLLTGLDIEITFDAPEKGKASKFTVRQGGQDTPASRMETEALKPADLAEYVGDYYSDELGTTYSLVVENGQLDCAAAKPKCRSGRPLRGEWLRV